TEKPPKGDREMKDPTVPQPPAEVAAIFEGYPAAIGDRLMTVRRMIFETAAAEAVGPLTETLKWGEPAYLTEATRAGSTVRLGWKPAAPDRFALYFNCNTSLVEDFRRLFPDRLSFEGNRAIVLKPSENLDNLPLGACIAMALTYHRNKNKRPKN
ncbi:MAG: DUF1801 domain-containing protein, partial [Rhodospirillales bacterium]|nr:DUF1801 domain-containing protein [Rhodospirillales bacterium]